MTEKYEALRLADRLRDGWGLELRREAEAELRRLVAQRDALLELVQQANSALCGTHTVKWQQKAQAAIKNAEGEKE
jgi:hypothetical protein